MGMRMDSGGFVTAKGLRKLQKYAEKGSTKFVNGATELYQAMDDIWKLYGWQNEMVLGKSPVDAAEMVRNTYPTYSKIAKFSQGLRRAPLIGTFFSFTAEVIRTGKNAIKFAYADAKKGDFRRLIGTTTAVGLTAGGAGYLGDRAYVWVRNKLDGEKKRAVMSSQETYAMREFLAPWEKNSQLFIVDRNKDEISFVDIGYTDPHSVVSDSYRALKFGIQDGDIEGAVYDAAENILDPFITEGLVTEKIVDVLRNTKRGTGGAVVNEGAPTTDKVLGKALHITEAIAPPLTPGIGSQAKRIQNAWDKEITGEGRRSKLYQEALSTATGVRVRTINLKQAFRFRIIDIKNDLDNARKLYNKPVYKEGSKLKDIEKGRLDSEAARKKAFDDFQRVIHAGGALGISEGDMFMIVKEQMDLLTGATWFNGTYIPYIPGQKTIIKGAEKFGNDFKITQ